MFVFSRIVTRQIKISSYQPVKSIFTGVTMKKQTKISSFFKKSPVKSEPIAAVQRSPTVSPAKSDTNDAVVVPKKNGRKRAIIYSDEEDSPKSSPVKSSPKEEKKSPEPEKRSSSSREVTPDSPPVSVPKEKKKETNSKDSKKSEEVKESKKRKTDSSKETKNTIEEDEKKSDDRKEPRSQRSDSPKETKSTVEENDKKSDDKKEPKKRKSDPPEEAKDIVEKEDKKADKVLEKKNGSKPATKQAKLFQKWSKSPKEPKSKKAKVEKASASRSSSEEKDEEVKTTPKMEVDEDAKEEKLKENGNEDKDEKSVIGKGAVRQIGLEKPVSVGKGWNIDYDPSKPKYHPIDDASWQRGQPTPYLALAITKSKIEETSSRLKNIEILANFFRSVILLSPQDLRCCIYLCLNQLAPAYEGIELGVAETNLIKAISQAYGRTEADIKKQLAEEGDLGKIAEMSRSSQRTLFQPAPLTVAGVFAKLREIASMTGKASTQKKFSAIQSVLVACKYCEARFVVRSLAGKLRIGLAEQSMLQALGQACFLTPPNQNQTDKDTPWPPPPKMIDAGRKMREDELKAQIEKTAFRLKSCFCECPNYDILVDALLKEGIEGVEKHCKLTPGIPPRPMLAQPSNGVEDILKRFSGMRFTCEYKYDGERAQIHLLQDGAVHIYSRNQENNTSKYPDIVRRFKDCIGPNVETCIIDSEAVAWDRENDSILPFQVLSTRKRKDAAEAEVKVQVNIMAFDLIYLNGKSLVKEPLIKRRELLRENFKVVSGQFQFAQSLDTDSMEEVQEFLEESIKNNCEGLMVKTLEDHASYELAKRSQKWLKLKKDYLTTGGDSLDLVVIGGFLGKGKRTGGYGGYLLACYDPDNEEYQTICKIGTGFSDEQLQQQYELFKEHIIPKPKPYYQFDPNLTPDHWFEPAIVWEVKCADLSLSPVHKAAIGYEDPQRGISLRFPRFIRLRDDKKPEDATPAEQVHQMYRNQDIVKNSAQSNGNQFQDDDFY